MKLRNALDRWLSRVSMYRFVSIALTLLFAHALLLAALGQLPFSIFEMAVCALLLVSSVIVSTLLFGYLFKVSPHYESSYITAMILFFVLSPTTEVRGVSLLILAAVVASASKYLLVYKKRHIFNPVAIAVVLIGFLGLSEAWWVATPVLSISTALLAFLILYKTRRLLMGGVFVAVSALLLLSILLINGAPFALASSLLLSWPIIFFAGFMLSEPLTLPPRKHQQLIEALLIGGLFAQPLLMDSFSITPALALVIGNLFAFVVARRRLIHLQLKSSSDLTPSTKEFTFQSQQPVEFQPGQYIDITLPHAHADMRGQRRAFSVVSVSGEDVLKIGVKFYEPSSSFKTALRQLKSGDIATGVFIGGDFVLPKDSSIPLVFIAGGIGITPFISHLQSLRAKNEKRDITLLYAVNDMSEIAYLDILQSIDAKVYVITENIADSNDSRIAYIASRFVTKDVVAQATAKLDGSHVYISGPPAMVSGTKRIVTQLGARKVKTDYFTGY